MNLFRIQLQAASDLIEGFDRQEDVQQVAYFTQPTEPFSLTVRITYRKTGQSNAPLLMTSWFCISKYGVARECSKVYKGDAYYGYIGALIPIDITAPNIRIL